MWVSAQDGTTWFPGSVPEDAEDPSLAVGRKEDAERPKGRILQRGGPGIPFCDYRAAGVRGRTWGKRVEGQTGKGPDSHARVCLGGRWHTQIPSWSCQVVTKSAPPPPHTLLHPGSPRPCETRGDLARGPHARDSNPCDLARRANLVFSDVRHLG